jgi:hypothetical protein
VAGFYLILRLASMTGGKACSMSKRKSGNLVL